jgi:hypothetical protein
MLITTGSGLFLLGSDMVALNLPKLPPTTTVMEMEFRLLVAVTVS